ncbi:MAG: hypothetical protein DLM52_03130 [Chthoniobacterales bacterium]|nr:MAG: hypothetical protein DLM52_03130 [Chthoniobacterales bacterium]
MNNEYAHQQCLALMEALIQYRHQPIYRQLRRFGKRQSMLHSDVLQLLYHLGRIARGGILEIGAFRGGSTVAVALGLRQSGAAKKFITIEQGGRLRGHRLGTRNILHTLKRNLGRQGVDDIVTVVKGRSSEDYVVAAVKRALAGEKLGLIVLDADAEVKRDLERFGLHMIEHCWVVIDDYGGSADAEKSAPIKCQVDEFVAAGSLLPLGYYGNATWFGQWLKPLPAR